MLINPASATVVRLLRASPVDTRMPGKKSPVPAEIVRLPLDGAVHDHQTVCPPPIASSAGSSVAPTLDAGTLIAVPFIAARALKSSLAGHTSICTGAVGNASLFELVATTCS